ncbi:MAG: hypothetical protein NXI30_20710 [bacterium]|nr:hypothetical protein [bacterium]
MAVRISQIAPESGVAGIELDLDFDSQLLLPQQASDEGYFGGGAILLENDTQAPDVNFAVASATASESTTSGLLLTLSLMAGPGQGVTELVLGDVVLAGAGGERIPLLEARNATIQVPEPGFLIASSAGLVLLGLLARARATQRRSGSRATRSPMAFSTLAGLVLAGSALADPDTNLDGFVNVQDVSLVATCQGVDPAAGPPCDAADVDEDGDVDADDLTAVVAAFGDVVGPPFQYAGPLFDCVRDAYPCDLSTVPDAMADRMDEIGSQAASMLDAGASLSQVGTFIAAEPDVANVFLEGHTLAFRLVGAPPIVFHDAQAARTQSRPVGEPFVSTDPIVPSFPGTSRPLGHRVVGRDRDQEGRRDREKRALVLAPFSFQFNYDSDVAANAALASFPEYGEIVYHVDDQVTIDDYVGWDDFDAIFVSTHGDAISGEINGTRLSMQTLSLGGFAIDCADLREAARPNLPGANPVVGIGCAWKNIAAQGEPSRWRFSVDATPDFFTQHYPQALENAFVWLDACRSSRVPGFQNTLMGRHSVFLGWDEYVHDNVSTSAAERIFELALDKGLRTSRAWEIACEEGFCFDTTVEEAESCLGEDPQVNPDCDWVDIEGGPDGDGDIDAADLTAWIDENEKPAELLYAFDGADQRLREILTILDPDTLLPAGTDGTVLPKDFTGTLGDGLPADGFGFTIEVQGFELEDLIVPGDPDEFLETISFISADRDGVNLESDLPLSQDTMVAVGPPEDYRWRSTMPMRVFLPEDLEPGETLRIDPKLRFPPTLGSLPVEIGNSYAEPLEHVIEACDFQANASGAAVGSFGGTLATIDLDSDWEISVVDVSSFGDVIGGGFPSPFFTASLAAARVGDLPGTISSMSVQIPSPPPFGESFSWNPSLGASLGLAAPSISITSSDGEMATGVMSGQLASSVDPGRIVTVSITFDADYANDPLESPCVR